MGLKNSPRVENIGNKKSMNNIHGQCLAKKITLDFGSVGAQTHPFKGLHIYKNIGNWYF